MPIIFRPKRESQEEYQQQWFAIDGMYLTQVINAYTQYYERCFTVTKVNVPRISNMKNVLTSLK